MTMLLFGVNNTLTFNLETRRINADAMNLFNKVKALESTLMAQLVKQFLALLEANGGKLDDATREKALGILKAIDEKYGLAEQTLADYGQWMSGSM